jgi:hypothetical protein
MHEFDAHGVLHPELGIPDTYNAAHAGVYALMDMAILLAVNGLPEEVLEELENCPYGVELPKEVHEAIHHIDSGTATDEECRLYVDYLEG